MEKKKQSIEKKNKPINKRDTVTLKVQPQELDLTSLKELIKKSKFEKKQKKDRKGLIIGIIITILGVLALIASLLINRYVDREYFSDLVIIFIMGVSLFTLIVGLVIVAKES